MSDLASLKTQDALLEALSKGVSVHPSFKDLFEQRVSFIYGSMSSDSDITRDRIREVLEENQGDGRGDSIRANGK